MWPAEASPWTESPAVGQHAREVSPRGLGRHVAPEPSDAGEIERGGPRTRRVECERQPDLLLPRDTAKRGGMIPTIVRGTSFTTICPPRAWGSP